MRKHLRHLPALLLGLLPLLLGSCRQELCYDHYPLIDVNFTWEQEWERDYGHHHIDNWDKDFFGCDYEELRPGVPEWVNMVSYYADGHQHTSFMSPDGRRFQVEAGEARSILLYNGDTEYIVVSDVASLNEARAEATSRSRSRSSLEAIMAKHTNARTTNPPDVLYSAFMEQAPSLKNHDTKDLPVKMQPLVFTYHITYEFECGFEHVALARGAIGGMAESVYLRTGVTSEATSIILFDCELGANNCQARVRSFGVPAFPDIYYGRAEAPESGRPGSLNIELMLRNGKTLVYDFDITDQLEKQPRGGVIKVGGIRIEPEQAEGAGGFIVDVDGWDDQNGEVVDLPIGFETVSEGK